ncbi:hypothetical protein evm_012039 [Chilo suppressalis]|nr:hypothetical protein evm_012039 [Chilo suppressalis]
MDPFKILCIYEAYSEDEARKRNWVNPLNSQRLICGHFHTLYERLCANPEFYRGTSAAETTVYGTGVAKESTVRFWFQRFRSGNFDLQNQHRGRPETKVQNEELKAIVGSDPSQSNSEIAAGFGQLKTMKEELAAKQPRLVNRSRPLLLHDNARPHTAQQITTKLDELQLEYLPHPPYSPDLALTDYHFLQNLDNFLQEK